MASVAQKLSFLGHFFSFFSLFLQIFGVHEHNHSHFVVIMYQYTHLTTGTIKLPIFDWLIFSQSASWLKSVGVKENIFCLKWSGWAPMSQRVQHLAGQIHLLKVAISFDVKWWGAFSFESDKMSLRRKHWELRSSLSLDYIYLFSFWDKSIFEYSLLGCLSQIWYHFPRLTFLSSPVFNFVFFIFQKVSFSLDLLPTCYFVGHPHLVHHMAANMINIIDQSLQRGPSPRLGFWLKLATGRAKWLY